MTRGVGVGDGGDSATWRELTLCGSSATRAESLVSLLELLLGDEDDDDDEGFEDDDDEGFDDDPEDPLPDKLDDAEPLVAPSGFDRSVFSFSFIACILASFSLSLFLSGVSFASLEIPDPDPEPEPEPEPELDLLSPLAFSALSFSFSACIMASFSASRLASVDEPELGLTAAVEPEDGPEDEVRDEVEVDCGPELGDVSAGALSSCETIWRVKNSNSRNPRVLLTWQGCVSGDLVLRPRANSATWSQ
jgi:hypothetical protein